jgi:hypothetical protein
MLITVTGSDLDRSLFRQSDQDFLERETGDALPSDFDIDTFNRDRALGISRPPDVGY